MSELPSYLGTLNALSAENALRRSRLDAEIQAHNITGSLRRSRNQNFSPIRRYNIERDIIHQIQARGEVEEKAKLYELRHTDNAIRREKLLIDLNQARKQTQEQLRRQHLKGASQIEQQVYEKTMKNQIRQEQFLREEHFRNSRTEAMIEGQIYRNILHKYA